MSIRMKAPGIALNTSVYDGVPLTEALALAADLGFDAVELVADVPHLFPPTTSVAQVARLGEVLAAHDLAVANLVAETGRGFYSPIPAGPIHEPSLITPQGASRRSRMQSVLRVLDFACMLKAPCVTIASGAVLPGLSIGMAWEHLQEGLAVLLARAEELGVLVAIAPRPGHLIARTEDFLSLHEALPHPLLGISLDLAQMAAQGEALPAACLACSGRIWSVQVTDACRGASYRLAPGQGDVDLAGMLAALKRSGFGGPYTLQLENYQEAPDRAARNAMAAVQQYLQPVASAS